MDAMKKEELLYDLNFVEALLWEHRETLQTQELDFERLEKLRHSLMFAHRIIEPTFAEEINIFEAEKGLVEEDSDEYTN